MGDGGLSEWERTACAPQCLSLALSSFFFFAGSTGALSCSNLIKACTDGGMSPTKHRKHSTVYVCACVCVCERVRERERERGQAPGGEHCTHSADTVFLLNIEATSCMRACVHACVQRAYACAARRSHLPSPGPLPRAKATARAGPAHAGCCPAPTQIPIGCASACRLVCGCALVYVG